MASTDNVFLIETRLDLTRFNEDIAKLEGRLEKVGAALSGGSSNVRETEKLNKSIREQQNAWKNVATEGGKTTSVIGGGIKDTGGKTQDLNKNLAETKDALADVGRRVFVWGSLSAAIFGAIQALREAYDFTVKLNRAMLELQKVLDDTSGLGFFQQQVFQLSFEFGAAPLDVAGLFKRFAQAGLEANEALEATRTALLGINTTGSDTEEILTALVAANRIFNIEFSKSAEIIDKIQKIEIDFAVDPKDLIDSIAKIGPVVKTLNGDIDDLFATIAALGEAARISGTEAANSLKRIFSRIVSDEGVQALQNLGVAVFATADTFRPLQDILGDISKQWATATDVEKESLAVTLAQVRQYPKFIALIDNYNRVLDGLNEAENSFGAANRANAIVLQSYEKQVAKASAQTSEFLQAFLEGGAVNQFTNFRILIGDVAGVINKDFVKAFGVITFNAGILTVSILALNSAMNAFGRNALPKAISGLAAFKTATIGTKAEIEALSASTGVAISRFTVISRSLLAGLGGAFVVISLLGPAISAFIKDLNKTSETIDGVTKELVLLKKGLSDLDLGGVLSTDVETKYVKLINFFKSLKDKAIDAKDPINSLKTEIETLLGQDIQGSPTLNQLDILNSSLKQLQNIFDNLIFKDLGIELAKEISKADSAFNEFINDINTKINQGIPETRGVFFKGLKEFLSDLDGNIPQNAITVALGQDSKTFRRQFGESPIRNTAEAILGLVDYLRQAREELNELSKTADQSALEDFRKRDIDPTEKSLQNLLIQVLDVNKIISSAAEEAGIKLNTVLGADTSATNLSILKDNWDAVKRTIFEIAKVRLQEVLGVNLNVDQLKKLEEAVNNTKLAATTLVGALDVVAFISGLKRTNAAVLSGFVSQLEVINNIKGTIGEIPGVFEPTKQAVDTVTSAIEALNTNFRENQSLISSLKLELGALEKARAKGKDLFGNTLTASSAEDLGKKIDSVKTRLASTLQINEENKKIYPEQIKFLVQQLTILQKINKQEELNSDIIKASGTFRESILQEIISLNNDLANNDPFKTFALNQPIFEDILQIQLKTIDSLHEIGNLSEAEALYKKDEATLQAIVNRELERTKAQAEEVSRVYKQINNQVDQVRTAFRDLLGDQEGFLKLFDGGKGRDFLGGFFENISGAVFAPIIDDLSEQLTQGFANIFSKSADETKDIIDRLKKQDISFRISSALTTSGAQLSSNLSDSIVGAFSSSASTFDKIPQLHRQGIESVNWEALGARLGDGIIGIPKFKSSYVGTFSGDFKGAEPYKDIINRAATANNLDANLLVALLHQESRFNPNADSGKAAGIAQITPATAEYLGITVAERMDPEKAIPAAAKYLRELLDKFGDIELALAGYNAGGGAVEKYGGIPPFPETQKYVPEVMAKYAALTGEASKQLEAALTIIPQNFSIVDAMKESAYSIQEAGAQFKDDAGKGGFDFVKFVQDSTPLLVSRLGQALAGTIGGNTEAIGFGSNVGAALGLKLFGSTLGGGIGSAAGGLLAALLSPKQSEQQTRELIEIRKNTAQLVDRLSPEIFNAPSTFSLPVNQGQGAGITVQNSIVINGAENIPNVVAQLEDQLNNLYNRSNRSRSILR